MDCTSCEELREIAPEFVQKGVTDNVAEHLANNTGYGGKSTNCNDLPLANDCLIGRMPSALAAYNDCDWKEWARDFSQNVYQMMASMIAAWCQLTGSLQTAPVKIIYTRDVGTPSQSDVIHYWYLNGETSDTPGDSRFIDLYMDAKEGESGNISGSENIKLGKTEADRDYAVIVTHCFDMQDGFNQEYDVTWYCSDDRNKYTLKKLREVRGQHPELNMADQNKFGHSWPVTETVYVKKGTHLQCEIYCRDAYPSGEARCRVHQIAATWIPINSVEVGE